jgi:hypothetical protein
MLMLAFKWNCARVRQYLDVRLTRFVRYEKNVNAGCYWLRGLVLMRLGTVLYIVCSCTFRRKIQYLNGWSICICIIK